MAASARICREGGGVEQQLILSLSAFQGQPLGCGYPRGCCLGCYSEAGPGAWVEVENKGSPQLRALERGEGEGNPELGLHLLSTWGIVLAGCT